MVTRVLAGVGPGRRIPFHVTLFKLDLLHLPGSRLVRHLAVAEINHDAIDLVLVQLAWLMRLFRCDDYAHSWIVNSHAIRNLRVKSGSDKQGNDRTVSNFHTGL